MIRSFARGGFAAAAVALLLGLAAVPAWGQDQPASTTTTTAPRGTTGAPKTPSGDPAIDDLVGCVQGSRQLLVLFLIDESASLKVTDPDDRRVDAARGALDSLLTLASSSGSASPNVDVALAAFSNEYRLVQDWTPAGPDTAQELNDSLDSFADFNSGIDTDFVNALTAAREALADQAAVITSEGGEAPCRAIMLFTDGGYDLAVRTSSEDQERLGTTKPYAPGVELTTKASTEKAEALGRKALCEPGQLADQLRSDQITLLTVALSGNVARRAQLPLAAATAGIADDYPCGTQPKDGEESRPQGAYLPAEDIDVLVTQFDSVGTRLAGGSVVPGNDQVEICGDEPCKEGSRTFTLDASLRRAHVFALAPKPGATVVLEAPGGATAEISKAGTSTIDGTKVVAASVAGRGFSIDLTRPDGSGPWAGSWTATITDPEQQGDRATLQVYVFSDIGVAFGNTKALERGATSEFEVVLELPKGVKAEDVIETAEASVRLRNPVTGDVVEVPLEGEPAGPFTGTYDTPASLTSNVVDATAEVRITTTGDAALVEQSAPREIGVNRPKGSIQFAPPSIQMPSLTGAGTTDGEMVLLGGDAAGCVWFGTTALPRPPDGAAPVEFTLEDGSPLPTKGDCIKVAAKRPITLVLQATPSGRASGTVSGTLQVFEQVEGKAVTTTEVPFRFDMARGVDQAQRLLLTALLLIAGLGLPLAVLMIINTIGARFQDLDAVRGAAIPVRVVGTTISRTDASYARPLTLKSEDFGSLATAGSSRHFTFGGVEFRARASRNPFEATIALAVPEGGAEKLKGRVGSRVELDPSLAGSWIFLLDSEQTRRAERGTVVGLLLAFVAEGDVAPQVERMKPDIAKRLPDTASTLAGLVRSTRAKPKKARSSRSSRTSEAPADGGANPVDDAVESADPVDPAGAAGAAGADGADPASTPAPAADAPDPSAPSDPSAPVGFGGRAAGGVPSAPAEEAPKDGDDDEPGPPPAGFTGGAPG